MTTNDDPTRKIKTRAIDSPQIDKFREAARKAETDDREEAFDATLKRVAKAPPLKDSGSKGQS